MCIAPKGPSLPAPETPKQAPRFADSKVQGAGEDAARRNRARSGMSGTILSGPMGAMNGANTSAKTLLGM